MEEQLTIVDIMGTLYYKHTLVNYVLLGEKMSAIPTTNLKELLDAGVHFGHKPARWNPKMAPYLYGAKDNTHIIDLRQTVNLLPVALKVIYDTVKKNGKILFVSTKLQATEIIEIYAQKCGQHYVNHRWLGGMLTNWKTISRSIKTLDELEKTLNAEDVNERYTKKERLNLSRNRDKLLYSLGGIRTIGGQPDLLIVIDTNREHLAIQEAKKLNIPIIAILDSNSNPDDITYPVPGNDDAIRSIKLYCSLFADAALAGMEESLVESGVDLGAVLHNNAKTHDKGGIKKLNPTNKIAKTEGSLDKKYDSTSNEFEEGLLNSKDNLN